MLSLLDEAIRAGARQFKACEVLGLSERTVQRWRQQGPGTDRRRGPKTPPSHALTPAERRKLVEVATSPESRDQPPSQFVPQLAEQGIYFASESSFYRVLREEKMQHHRGPTRAPRKRPKPDHGAREPGQVWCWDITYLPTRVRGRFWYLYLMEDVFSRKIVGWSLQECESMEFSSQLLERACQDEGIPPGELVVHSDNGSPMKGSTMLATMQRLGVVASFSRPSVSHDNAFAEALFRTLKYRPEYPRQGFETLEQAREWVEGFVQWYNEEHRHSAIGWVTPGQRHRGEDRDIHERRRQTYEAAKARHPERWKGRDVREWKRPTEVYLTPRRADGL